VRMCCPVTPKSQCLLALQFAAASCLSSEFAEISRAWCPSHSLYTWLSVHFWIHIPHVFIMYPHIVRHERNTSDSYVIWQMLQFVNILTVLNIKSPGQKGSRNPEFLKWSHGTCLFSLLENSWCGICFCAIHWEHDKSKMDGPSSLLHK
jgi:hypothetical protein